MRTQEEIVTRIQERFEVDTFGFEVYEYIKALDYKHAKPYLKPEVTKSMWKPLFKTDKDVRNKMINYMPFAWEKANSSRGISAYRSICHYTAWLWLLGEEKMAEEIQCYEYYGKPQLRRVCEFLGLDADKWDDGVRVND